MDFVVNSIIQLRDLISGPLGRITGQITATNAATAGLAARMSALAKAMLQIVATVAVLIGTMMPAVGVAASFEEAISGLGAISQASAADIKKMERSALDLGASTEWSARQVAGAEAELARKGWQANNIVAGMPGLLNLASAAKADLGVTAGVVSSSLNSFNMEATRSGEVADIIAKASSTSATSIDGIAMAVQNAGAVASAAGADFALLAAITGKLADKGIAESVGATATKIMFSRLQAPTGEAAATLRQLGVATQDAHGNMLPFLDIMQSLETGLAGKGTAQQAAALKQIFGDEAVGSVTALLNTGIGTLRNYAASLNEPGFAARVAAQQMDNLNGKAKLFSSAMEGLGIVVGKVFLPPFKLIVGTAAEVVGWLAKLADTPVGRFLVGLTGIVTVGAAAFTAYTLGVWAVAIAAPFATTALAPLATMIAAVSWPVWLLIAAVAALAAAFYFDLGGIGSTVKSWWDSLSLIFSGVREVLGSVNGGVGQLRGELAKKIEAAGLLGIVTTIARVAYRLGALFSALWEQLSAGFSVLGEAFSPVASAFGDAFRGIGEAIGAVLEYFGVLSSAAPVGAFSLLGTIIGGVLRAAFQVLAIGIRVALFPLQVFFRLIQGVAWIVGSVTDVFSGLINVVRDGVVGIVQWIAALFSGLDFSSALGVAWDAVVSFFSNLSLFESGKKLLTTLADGISSAVSDVVGAVSGALGKVREFLPFSDAKRGPLSTLTASGIAISETLAKGVSAGSRTLLGSADVVASNLAAALTVGIPARALADADINVGPPAIAGQEIEQTSPRYQRTGPGRNNAELNTGSQQISISIQHLNLPEVKDSNTFITALQRMVEAHDV